MKNLEWNMTHLHQHFQKSMAALAEAPGQPHSPPEHTPCTFSEEQDSSELPLAALRARGWWLVAAPCRGHCWLRGSRWCCSLLFGRYFLLGEPKSAALMSGRQVSKQLWYGSLPQDDLEWGLNKDNTSEKEVLVFELCNEHISSENKLPTWWLQ